jgi:hypothetical protein
MNRRICFPVLIAAAIVFTFTAVSADRNPQGCSEGCVGSHCVKIDGECVLASRTTCWEYTWGVGAGGTKHDNPSEQVTFEVRQYCEKECTGKEESNATGCDGMKLDDYGSSQNLCWGVEQS